MTTISEKKRGKQLVLETLRTTPGQPLFLILGGSNTLEKLQFLEAYQEHCHRVLIGGRILLPFLQSIGIPIDDVDYHSEAVQIAGEILSASPDKVLLPSDVLVAGDNTADARIMTLDLGSPIPNGWSIVDIGPFARADFCRHLTQASSIIWHGLLGNTAVKRFAQGSAAIANCISSMPASKIAAGKGTVDFLKARDCMDCFDHTFESGHEFRQELALRTQHSAGPGRPFWSS